ncbi:Uu.00g083200.m01.CDS01 [Anthostomella pinea]|uniref:Uu.00g083200.m01.CDS01 n=1 Tax=Anthostomella pinea TaxID=933095 RepID=A0AAI8VLI7_9PEZI|nr:Uu.00g083200.m01.CDS01 [Anthostomella pinea]
MPNATLVLPRPGTAAKPGDEPQSIPAPSEEAFVATFGNLLPQASYLRTCHGRAAYYIFPATAGQPTTSSETPPTPRVLLIHGVQTPALGMQPLARELSTRFPHAQIVLVDLWGHGLSDTPLAPHDPPLFHALVEALLHELGWADAHFVGYSFGASTVASLAAARPELVASMVIIAPAGLIRSGNFSEVQRGYLRGGEGVEEQARAWILDWLEGGELVVPKDWKERVGRGEVVAKAVKDWELREHEGHAASVVAIFRDGGALDRHAEFAKAARTGIKHLCIMGEKDDVSSAEELQGLGLRNVEVVPDVGHAVVRERVQEVAQLIEEFWNRL